METPYDVIVIGAGAAGFMAAIECGRRGRRVWLVDHADRPAEKIRISGGGRCNFTNVHSNAKTFLSTNPHFCKSALTQFSQHDFIARVAAHGIAYHEKTLGQLFCDDSSQRIIDMLLHDAHGAGVTLSLGTSIEKVEAAADGYRVVASTGAHICRSLIIATGGLSIPKMGATRFGYDIARQFGLPVIDTRAGLVPFTFQAALLERCNALSGLSVEATVSCGKTSFAEGLLFTHRGLSGPSILQISSYWREGDDIHINLAPAANALAFLKDRKTTNGKQDVLTAVSHMVPRRLAESICAAENITGRLADLPGKQLETLARALNDWRVKPAGTEGYRTAEVTLGGMDTAALSSKTMEAKNQPGLYFIGEVVDVTGHLGGFNFQWAWSSGFAAGQYA